MGELKDFNKAEEQKELETSKSEFGENSPEDIKRIEQWLDEEVESAFVKMIKIKFSDNDSLYGKFIGYNHETQVLIVEEYVPDSAGYKSSGEKKEIGLKGKKVKQLSLRGGGSICL